MTTLPEFKPFSKIPRFEGLEVIITQKIHGTNAQVYIEKCPCACHEYHEDRHRSIDECEICLCPCDCIDIDNLNYKVYAGSRTRWLTPEDDNYGFAKWVRDNRITLIEFLGEGRHYGEWAGPGINSGEGLKQKTFVLFEPWRYIAGEYEEVVLPDDIKFVPILHTSFSSCSPPLDAEFLIQWHLRELKNHGSKLVPGYMLPEGIVITINGQRFKKTFAQEDVAWKPKKERVIREHVDYSYLCHPLRLEKLLSRDEKYIREYPKSLPDIAKAYIQNLKDENLVSGDEEEVKAIIKSASRQIFGFVKEYINGITKACKTL